MKVSFRLLAGFAGVYFVLIFLSLVLFSLTGSFFPVSKEKGKAMVIAAPPAVPLPPRLTTNVTYKWLGSFGRACNRVIQLSMALALAEEQGFIVVLDNWAILDKIDMVLLRERYGHLFKIGREKDWAHIEKLPEAHTFWCGLKMRNKVLRTAILPRKDFRQFAEEEIARMRSEGGTSEEADLMSVHIRHYDGLCENPVPNTCEWKQGYEFQPYPFGCNQTLTPQFLDWVRNDWPDHPWHAKRLNIYLATDRQVESIDQSYTNPQLRGDLVSKVFEPRQYSRKTKEKNEYSITSELFVDMWVSALTDFHVGMPLSSCDKVVSEWRSIQRPDDVQDTVHPRACYSGYFPSEEPMGSLSCPHTHYLGLDTSDLPAQPSLDDPSATCDFLLGLSLAVEKAKAQSMGLHLYGAWGRFAEKYLDLDSIRRLLSEVVINERLEQLLYERVAGPNRAKMRGSGVRSRNQAHCAKSLLLTTPVLPSLAVQEEVSGKITQLGTVSRRYDAREKQSAHCFCLGNSACPKYTDSSPGDNIDSGYETTIHDLWERAMVETHHALPSSSCSQVVAMWRAGLGRASDTMKPQKCFVGYHSEVALSTETTSHLVGVANGVWNCP